MVKLKRKKVGGDKYRYTALIDTKYSMNNVDVGLHSNDKSAIKTLNGILKRKFPKEKKLKEGTCGYGVDGKLGEEPAGPHLMKKKKKQLLKSKIDEFIEEACQKGYMTHPTRKTKIMFGKRYRNCVKKEGVNTRVTKEQAARIINNICVNCGDITNENLRKWFSDKWVNIG